MPYNFAADSIHTKINQSINLFSQLCKITNLITAISEKHSDGLPEKEMLI